MSYVEAKWFVINQILCKITSKQITQLSKLQAILLSLLLFPNITVSKPIFTYHSSNSFSVARKKVTLTLIRCL